MFIGLAPGVVTILCHGAASLPPLSPGGDSGNFLKYMFVDEAALYLTTAASEATVVRDRALIDAAPPQAQDDFATTSEDNPVSLDILQNDARGENDDDDEEEDKDRDSIEDDERAIDRSSVDLDPDASGSQTARTTAEGDYRVEDGLLTFMPVRNFFGSSSIEYTVDSKGGETSNRATIMVTVTAVNDAPRVTGTSGPLSVTAGSSISLSLENVVVEDPDNSADDLSLRVLEGPNYSVEGNSVTPDDSFSGVLPVTVEVWDGAASGTYKVELNVAQKENQPPVITGQNEVRTLEDVQREIKPADLVINDPDDEEFTVIVEDGENYSVNGATVIPDEDFSGELSVPVTVTDAAGNTSEPYTITVTVDPVNDPPVVTGQDPDPLVTGQGQPLTITTGNVIVSDPDTDQSYPEGYTLTIADGDNYTYSGTTITPVTGFSGGLLVNITITDPENATATSALNVSVTANSPPVITGQDPLSTDEENALAITLNNLEVQDPDSDPSTFTLRILEGDNYTVAGNEITPATNFTGTLTVPVVVGDGTSESAPFDLQVTVNNVNDAPVISGQVPLTTDENQPITISVSHLTVTDPDNAPETLSLSILGGENYTVSTNTITPSTGFNGTLTVQVFVNDGHVNSNFFPLEISVIPVNDTPVITGQRAISMNEGTSISLTLADVTVSDPDSNFPEDFTLIVQPGEGYTVSGTTVTPNPDLNGALTVDVAVSDGATTSATFGLQVTIIPVNDPPAITGHLAVSTSEDTPREITVADLIISDPDNATGFTLTVFPGDNYTLSGNTITPNPDFVGGLSVQVQVSDGSLTSNIYTLPVQVIAANDQPVITGQVPVETAEDTPVTIQLTHLTVLDSDNNYPSGFTLNVSPGANYTVSGSTITPAPDFNGTLNVPVSVSDGSAVSEPFIFQIQVGNANDAPTITGQSPLSTNEEQAVTILLSHLTVVDPDNAFPSGFTLLVSPGVNYSVNGTTVTPALNFAGTLTVPVRVNDGVNNSASFDFQLQVNQINDAPSFAAIPNQKLAENSRAGSVTITDISKGPMEDYQQLTFVANSSNTAVISDPVIQYNGTGTTAVLSYVVQPNVSGVVTLTVVAIDNGSNTPPNQNSYTAGFQVEVVEINSAPTLNTIHDVSLMEDAEQQNIALSGITAGPGENQALTVSVSTNKPELFELLEVAYTSPATTGVLLLKLKANAFGTAKITVTVTDNGSGVSPNVNTTSRSFSVVVQPVNDAPAFTSQPVLVAAVDEQYEYRVTATDVDGDKLTILVPTKPAWATFSGSGNGQGRLHGKPPKGSLGDTPVKLQVSDGSTVVEQSFTIYVNVRPSIADLSVVTEEDTPAPFPVNFFVNGFTDLNENPLDEVLIVSAPASGTLMLGEKEISPGDTLDASSLSELVYHPNEDFFGDDSFTWNGSDGYQFAAVPASVDINVLSVNDAPVIVLESDTLRYEVNGESAFVSPLLDILDPDDDTLTHASVGFYGGFSPEMELLEFQATPGIRAAYDFQAGLLEFSGEAPLSEYRDALRSVRYLYQNTIDPILEPKTVYFRAHDGETQGEPTDKVILLQYTFIEFNIPSGFTPNGDNANDTWIIDRPGGGLEEMTDAVISVYNKQGILVYRANGFNRPWDGRMNGQLLPADTYFFTIDLRLRSRKTYKGIVTILR